MPWFDSCETFGEKVLVCVVFVAIGLGIGLLAGAAMML